MKILVLADEESKFLYDYYEPGKLDGIELILACGDLHREYLEFFASMSRAPVLYVLGNHDQWHEEERPPGGCICIEDTIYVYRGLRILGLGGSMQYHPGKTHQYTEAQMRWRILLLWWKLIRSGGIDILVTHAAAAGIHDLEDLPHRGFVCFRELLERYHPKLFVHGHIHASYGGFIRTERYQDTLVVNGCGHYIVELEESDGGRG